ncbi:MAG: DUF2029 domain-containing protein [Planctomycetia bacterium]|nr:DUF2029 domain-containing protein [Planctomycetia bacterium]
MSERWLSRIGQNGHVRRAAWIVLAVALLVEAYFAVFVRRNDFVCHYNFGRDFLAGNPYGHLGNIYPLARAMFNGLLSLPNYYVSRAICLAAAVAGLAWSLWTWRRVAQAGRPIAPSLQFPTVLVSLIILAPLLIRDLDECGLQLLLLTMLTAGMAAVHSGRPGWAGFWLAAAASYKANPILFLPLLLWKREWKAAGWMAAWIVLLGFLPAAYLGWDTTLAGHRHFLAHSILRLRNTTDAHPSLPGTELPKHDNECLPAAIARFVETYPAGHPLYIDHPLFFQFGHLPLAQAKAVVTGAILLLGAGIAWSMRRRWNAPSRESGTSLPAEWAVACVFCALLSPLCWKQHLVLLLPCVYLLARDLLATPRGRLSRGIVVGATAVVLLGMRRGLIGEELALVCMSYNFITWAAVAATLKVLADRRVAAAVAEQPSSNRLPAQRLAKAA